MPLFYSQHLVDEIKNTTLEEIQATRRNVAYSSYAAFAPEVKAKVSKADFMWGLSIAWSRSFSVAKKVTDSKGDSKGQSSWQSVAALIPLVDFLNTGEPKEINVRCRTNKEGSFQCSTLRAIHQGEEFLVSYGARSNAQLLHDYGFVMFTNVNDHAIIKLPSPKHTRGEFDTTKVSFRKMEVQDGINRNMGYRDHTLLFKLNAPPSVNDSSDLSLIPFTSFIPPETFCWARVVMIDKYDIREAVAYEMIESYHKERRFSANNDFRAIGLIKEAIAEALAFFPQTIEQDLEAINAGELVKSNVALFWITLMRYYEKSVLHDVNMLIDEKANALLAEASEETAVRKQKFTQKKQELEEKKRKEKEQKAEKERLRREAEARGEAAEDDEADQCSMLHSRTTAGIAPNHSSSYRTLIDCSQLNSMQLLMRSVFFVDRIERKVDRELRSINAKSLQIWSDFFTIFIAINQTIV